MDELRQMEPSPLVEQFKLDAKTSLPGLVAYFDFADTKRRTSHLGHILVDEEIAEFDRLLRTYVGDTGIAKRVGGQSWLAFIPGGTVETLSELLARFQLEQTIEIGWTCTGEKDGESKVARQTIDSVITRAMRCMCSTVSKASDLDSTVEALRQQYVGLPPGVPVPLDEVEKHKRSYWKCVSIYPGEDPFCPFCEMSDFKWEDGDMCVYSGTGTCKNCNAEIDIRGVELLKS